MSKKRNDAPKNNQLLEIKVSTGLSNLQELTSSMSQNVDSSTFDILSIKRTDADEPYTRQYAHRKVANSHAHRIASNIICYLFPHYCKLKTN